MRSGTIAFLIGILAAQQLAALPDAAWGWLLPLCLVGVLHWPRMRVPLLACAGFLWAVLWAVWTMTPALPPALEGEDLVAVGEVASIPVRQGRRVRFAFDVQHWRRGGSPVDGPARVRLSWYTFSLPDLNAGERWRLVVRLKRPHGFRNPGGFDYERWLFRHGFGATGYVRNGHANTRLAPAPAYRLVAIRERVAEALERALPESANRGVVTALAVGERSAIRPRQWSLLTVTGTGHLLAISGLHIGLVSGFGFLAGRWLWSRSRRLCLWWPAARAGAVGALLCAIPYAALAGFAVPTRRALIMVGVAMAAVIAGRHIPPSRTLAAALLGVLILDPLSVLDAGFWLSFGAVAVILYAFSARVGPAPRLRAWGRVQWVVALGLLPLTVGLFQRASLIAPVANLVAVPWISLVVVPLVLLGTTLLAFSPAAAGALLQLVDWQLDRFWQLLGWLASPNWAQWSGAGLPMALGAAVLGALWLLAPRGFPARWAAIVLIAPLFLTVPAAPPPGAVRITVLDVGQGLAAVVRTRDHTLVYDTGPRFSAAFDAGSAVVVPFLDHQGVRRIDRLMVSHGDNDHAGGLAGIRDHLAVGRVLSGEPDAVPGASPCRGGMGWEWDGVQFAVLHPPAGADLEGNDSSCVLRITTAGASVLLAGDLQARGERTLLAHHRGALASNVLVAPHHGSATSSTAAFVQAVDPRIVVFATGYRNRYGFPKPAVVARYEGRNAVILNTARSGAITLDIDPRGVVGPPTSYRDTHRRYWHH